MQTPTRPIAASEQSTPIDRAYLTPPRLPTFTKPDPLLVRLASWLDVPGTDREASIKLRHVYGLSGASFVVDLLDGDRVVASGVAMTQDLALARAFDAAEREDA